MRQSRNPFSKMSVVTIAVCLSVVATQTRAADWPQWRGANRDGKTDFKPPATWPKELTQKWRVVVGDGVAAPALAGGKIYVQAREDGNEVTRCLDASTGKELWQDKYEVQPPSGPAAGYSGPRSSPCVADGKVITYGLRGTLTCFDAASGKVVWRKESTANAWPKFFTSSSPLIADGLCVAQVGGETEGAVVAYDLGSGAEKWKWTGDGTAYASPVLGDVGGVKVVIAQTDKRIIAVGLADGKLLWEKPYMGSGMGGMNTATPIMDGQTLIYSGSGRGTRAAKFEKQGDTLAASELWSNSDNSIQYNSPVLKDGLIFGLSARDVLYCVNEKDGKTAWSSPFAGKRGFGSIVEAGPVLFVLTPVGNLVAFEPSDKEFKQLASYKVADGNTGAHPVIAGNQVLVKDKDSLTLWTIE